MTNPLAQIVLRAQEYLATHSLSGWLLYDYQNLNQVFWEIIGDIPNVTRPCWLWIPVEGSCTLLVSYVDSGRFDRVDVNKLVFISRQQMKQHLIKLLEGSKDIVMEYSPDGELPRVSRIDAGTLELVRSVGVHVLSSGDLVQHATQLWGANQLDSHLKAAGKLDVIVQETFSYIGETLAQGLSEHGVAEFIRCRFLEEGMEVSDGPVVAVNAHSSDPHFEPTIDNSRRIQPGDWILIDLWSRLAGESTMFADITWTAYVGSTVPAKYQRVFDIVIGARDAALSELEATFADGRVLEGWELDKVARDYISKAGYGEYFNHRLGHSLGVEVHSNAVNLDGWETHDNRKIVPGIGMTIEPGIYCSEFGVRSEIDVYMSQNGPRVTTEIQRSVVLISS